MQPSHASVLRKAEPGTLNTGVMWTFPGWWMEEFYRSLGPSSSQEAVQRLKVWAAEPGCWVWTLDKLSNFSVP